jgi:hypothetical protein
MCMIDDCDEPYKVYRKEDRRAVKAHKCDECRREIHPGEAYRWSTGLADGHWYTNRICAHCGVAADWLIAECGGFLNGAIDEDIKEHAEEYGTFGLWRLYAGMRRKWKRGDGLMPIPQQPRLTA